METHNEGPSADEKSKLFTIEIYTEFQINLILLLIFQKETQLFIITYLVSNT